MSLSPQFRRPTRTSRCRWSLRELTMMTTSSWGPRKCRSTDGQKTFQGHRIRDGLNFGKDSGPETKKS